MGICPLGIKQLRHQADLSLLTSAMIEWMKLNIYYPTGLYGMYRDKCSSKLVAKRLTSQELTFV
jgi:hypothetical protein